MWRQLAAVLVVVGLVIGAAHFFRISFVAKAPFAFDPRDVMSAAVGMWMALVGGIISRRYGFVLAVGAMYLVMCCLAVHFLNRYMDDGFLAVFLSNGWNIVATLLSGMLGACIGVFIGSGKRRAGGRVLPGA